MKRRITGRILSVALTLIMALALLPVSATAEITDPFTENGKTYYSLGNLEDNVSSSLLQKVINSSLKYD